VCAGFALWLPHGPAAATNPAPQISVTFPSAPQLSFIAGEIVNVTWTSQNPRGNVTLFVTRSGATEGAVTIGTVPMSEGTFA